MVRVITGREIEVCAAHLLGDGLGVTPALDGDAHGGGTGAESHAGEAEGVHGGRGWEDRSVLLAEGLKLELRSLDTILCRPPSRNSASGKIRCGSRVVSRGVYLLSPWLLPY